MGVKMINGNPIRVCGKVMRWDVNLSGTLMLRAHDRNWCAGVTTTKRIIVCGVYDSSISKFVDIPDPEEHVYETDTAAVNAVMARLVERGFVDPIDYALWGSA